MEEEGTDKTRPREREKVVDKKHPLSLSNKESITKENWTKTSK
jgi:hypothetical protein